MGYQFKLSKNYIYIGLALIITLIGTGYFYALPAAINIEKYRPEIEEYIDQRVIYPVELGKLKISLTPSLNMIIKADSTAIKKNDGTNFLKADKTSVEIYLPGLLKNEVIIKGINFDNLNANITRLPNGEFDVMNILAEKKYKKYKVKINDANIDINRCNIKFRDKYIQPNQLFIFQGKKLLIRDFTPSKEIKIIMDGKLITPNTPEMTLDINFYTKLPIEKSKNFKAKGQVQNFNFEVFKPYINEYSSQKFKELKGIVNGRFDLNIHRNSYARNKFYLNLDGREFNIISIDDKDFLTNEGDLSLLAKGFYDKKIIFIEDFSVKSKGIDVRAYGRIDNYKNKKAQIYDLSLDIDETRIELLAKLFPKFIKVPKDPFKKILKHNIKAVTSGNVSIRGSYHHPKLFGDIEFSELKLLDNKNQTHDGNGTVAFLGDAIVIDTKLYIEPGALVRTSGKIFPFVQDKLNLDITTNIIPLNKTNKTILALKDLFVFKVGPLSEMEVKGKARVSLNIAGEFEDVRINGYADFKDAWAKHQELSAPVNNIEGRLEFIGERVVYDNLIGYVDNSKLVPSGYSTLKGFSDVKLDFKSISLAKALQIIKDSPLLEEVKTALIDIIKVKGTSNVIVHLVGEEKNLKADGSLNFKNAFLQYRGFGEPFTNLAGQLNFADEDIFFNNITGRAAKSQVAVNGTIKGDETVDINVNSHYADMAEVRSFIMKSSIMEDVWPLLTDYPVVKGVSGIDLNLKGNINQDPFQDVTFNVIDMTLVYKLIGIPIKVDKGKVFITKDIARFDNVKASIDGTAFSLNGSLSNLNNYNLKKEALIPDIQVDVDKFDLTKLELAKTMPIVPDNFKDKLNWFTNYQGIAGVNVKAKGEAYEIVIKPNNLYAVYAPYKMPVTLSSGSIYIDSNDINFVNLSAYIWQSNFYINGSVKDYINNGLYDIYTLANISSQDIEKLKLYFNIPIKSYGNFPLAVKLKGSINKWNAEARMIVDKGDYFHIPADIGLPRTQTRIYTVSAIGGKSFININRLRIDLANEYSQELLSIKNISSVYSKWINLINIHGSIDKINTKNPQFKSFTIKTSEENNINMKLFNPSINYIISNGNEEFFSNGKFETDLVLNGDLKAPVIKGKALFYDITIPAYEAYIGMLNFIFQKDEILIDMQNAKIADSDLSAKAVMDTVFDKPVLIKKIDVNSSYLNIDKINSVFSKNSSGEISALPPFVITEGHLIANELILRDLITSNINAAFSLTPDWLLSIPTVSFNTAGGEGYGNIYANIKTSEVSATLNVKQMQANALATTLLNLPNEVYGILDANLKFTTRGKNSQELIANSNGIAEFNIKNGRLVRLGSLEYLLRAVNVLHSGIGGFNINNIIDLIAPQKTGYFEELKGKVYANDGVLYTDEITTSGKNLSLFINGKFDMLTNDSNIVVLGKLSKKVSGLLGPIGSLTINQFIDYVPGLGFLPATPGEKGLIDILPGLSKIPGLELGGNNKHRKFAVSIVGDLYDPGSVNSFRWVE